MMIMVTSRTMVMTMTMTKMISNDHGESDACGDDYGYAMKVTMTTVIEMMVAS